MMKKLLISLIIGLLSVIMLPTTALAASDYTVDKLECTAELRKDGSVVVTQEWTVTFTKESDGFSRRIVIPEDNFESFASLTDMSVAIDGVACTNENEKEYEEDANTFSVAENGTDYTVNWHSKSEIGTKNFSMRYVLSESVKLYNERTYFYLTVVNDDENLVCRNVSVSVTTQGECFAENFEIIESDSLVGKKSDGEVLFESGNTAGEVKIALSMPVNCFDSRLLSEIVQNKTGITVALSITAVIICVLLTYIIYYAFNRNSIIRKKWLKRCRKRVLDETSYRKQTEIVKKTGAAKVLYLLSEDFVNGADLFIVNMLELVELGYIAVGETGFSVSLETADDKNRPLDKSDKIVLDAFSKDGGRKIISDDLSFYEVVLKHKKTLALKPFFEFTKSGKKVLLRSFELGLSAKRHEYISPDEISDDFFKNKKYSVADLVVSVLNEQKLVLCEDYKAEDTSKYSHDLFTLRAAYKKGQAEFFVRTKNTRRNTTKTETFDD